MEVKPAANTHTKCVCVSKTALELSRCCAGVQLSLFPDVSPRPVPSAATSGAKKRPCEVKYAHIRAGSERKVMRRSLSIILEVSEEDGATVQMQRLTQA
mmetsp:Transcript_4314/g.11814  ORF Transcript_4314/g.11814 Transcript_4314/m.11814 type:complete len:99 (+) Transcript_4314:85-381(+)|eukprot:CAMPEP_0185833000 /NCGR_PEP_ID=MMETSP1353-20130828/2420_1 /TAXON_ID=1077150 /ORGANISM="Erythrolobus australicus, Strain CCMP3124" /LENGTH=98 /DNA_ID=CAMNT_0028531241 /DNA_START=72 /DNA_END=368 /DNA_ORIENTATION=+